MEEVGKTVAKKLATFQVGSLLLYKLGIILVLASDIGSVIKKSGLPRFMTVKQLFAGSEQTQKNMV
jgi:hypothetical protein